MFGCQLGTVTRALDDDLVGGVRQPVQSTVAKNRVTKPVMMPVSSMAWYVACEQDALAAD